MRLIRLLKNDIAREAAEWVEEGVITETQAEKICDRYDVDFHQIQNRSFGYNVLIGLGYLFIGLAVITIIGANWDELPRALRMAGLIVLTLATNGLALRKYMSADTSGASVLFFLGCLFYGASIILIAQIYHLGEHMPDGIFWWALGSLPIALLINSRLVMLLSLLLATIWFFVEIDMGFYPYLFPVFLLSTFVVLYRGKQGVFLFLAFIASTTIWVEFSLLEYWSEGWYRGFHAEHVVVSVSLFIFAYVCSYWLSLKHSVKAKDYATVLAVWSLRFGLILMLVLSFEDPWVDLIQADWDNVISMLVVAGVLALATIGLAYNSKKLVPIVNILPFYFLTLMLVIMSEDLIHAFYLQIVYNLALIATGVWLILRGIDKGISHYFFLGVSTIMLTALMRYTDLVGDYIGGAILFMVFAALLIGAAKYWKRSQAKEATQ